MGGRVDGQCFEDVYIIDAEENTVSKSIDDCGIKFCSAAIPLLAKPKVAIGLVEESVRTSKLVSYSLNSNQVSIIDFNE